MNLKKFGRAVLSAVMALSVVACAQQPAKEETKNEPVSILCPTGAPSLAVLGAVGDENVTIEYTEGTDLLTAELAKADSAYDIIVAPTNLGTKIYANTQAYNLEAVLTWGNLYMVGPEGTDLSSANIAAFGEKAVPQLVFKKVYPELNPTYYASVQEAQQALLTGKADVALLAQPVAAATIAKAKEAGKEFTVLSNLQALYQKTTGNKNIGYPQASLFVKAGNQDKVQNVLSSISTFLTDTKEEAIREKIEMAGVENLGIPNAEIAVKTWAAQNINYQPAKSCKEDIVSFLQVFGMELPEGLIME
ncbi:MAG: hypothetical protein Q4C49_10775 [Bacillota bacterium]|nr:hypothetical protein [Bacillota bacterium]